MNLKDNIKALMFDIDGTIINRELKMPRHTKEALKACKDKGYPLIINTGRPFFSAYRVLKDNDCTDLFDMYYCCNGCERRKNERESFFINSVKPSTYHELDKYFKEDYMVMAAYYQDKYLLINHVPKDIPNYESWATSRYCEAKIVDFKELDVDFPKLIALYNPERKDEFVSKINSINNSDIEFLISGINVMEIVPRGINKGVAVSDYAMLNNLDNKQILTFGDAENDMDALFVGEGCFVEGKEVESSNKINYHCPSIYDEGVAKFLEDNLL